MLKKVIGTTAFILFWLFLMSAESLVNLVIVNLGL